MALILPKMLVSDLFYIYLNRDGFVYDPFTSTGELCVKVNRATLWFVSGRAVKLRERRARLPSGVVGIRGIRFKLSVDSEGNGWVQVHEGLVDYTPDDGGPVQVAKAGERIVIGIDF